jgi:photosystem II stability/assembly factor-like uncharacterized protein
MKGSKSLAVLLLTPFLCGAATYDAKLFAEMRWRPIGPLRGGRTRAAVGVPDRPNVFYIGVCNGGVWKTEDFGRTWRPIFDNQPTGSIGAIAVAPSNPDIIYVGSGEGLHRPDLSVGDGVYKSIDGGKTWTHLGLRNGQQIPQIVVDPRDPKKLYVAVLGHPYGPNSERGLYKSMDGGETFRRILFKDDNTGASDVQIDPNNPDTVYASMWEDRHGPWENAMFSGTHGGIFKSTDGGNIWTQLTRGLPDDLVQAYVAIAPQNSMRLYASVATASGGGPRGSTGIYRSDNAGESWDRITTDSRPAGRIGGGDLSVPTADPTNPEVVYFASTVVWKSMDGGKTYTGIRGAPGGDDYQRMWINPEHPQIVLIVSDQGAIVTVNGGESWSSWYNQPTAQMYHANTDNDFPYRVCSGQQESGSACVWSRGNYGQITMREWDIVGAEEYGYAVPDPLDPNIVFGGKVTRFDRRTGQVQNVTPKPVRPEGFRTLRTAPLVFSQAPGTHILYFGANTMWQTSDGARSWKQISPDLSRKTWDIPATIAKYRDVPSAKPTQRGVIYAISPSPVDVNRIWAGTDDGLIQTTADGGLHWKDVTPPQLAAWQKVSIIDAGHSDALTAYAAINTLRLDDMRPHIWRTHDGGKSWTEIIAGIPDGAPIDAVREDPKKKGLLFAGSEHEVYVSFDDGDHWQSLRLNMPATSIRDLTIHEDDLVAATHGRGFWILDDIAPLRQMAEVAAANGAYLLKPQTAVRVRWNMNQDTPLPPDEPSLPNPPDGAIIDYYLVDKTAGPVTLEILDSAGALVRKYSSADPVDPIDPMIEIPTFWVRPSRPLSGEPGLHRFEWDLHYTPLNTASHPEYPIQAVPLNTTLPIASLWVLPGRYTVKLTAGGKVSQQPLTVKMDPRVKTPMTGLQQQFTLSKQLYEDVLKTQKAFDGLGAAREKAKPDLEKETASLTALLGMLEETDATPTTQLADAVAASHAEQAKLLAQWAK